MSTPWGVSALLAALAAGAPVRIPSPPALTPSVAPAEEHSHGVDRRGDHVMGFDHEKTAHHFRLTRRGGSIEASARNAADRESRDRIRTHFARIARKFSEGDFDAPALIHGLEPPGVASMKRLRRAIRYRFVTTDRGARILISTKNREALAAIHEFLRFQIQDHRTGDPQEVGVRPLFP